MTQIDLNADLGEGFGPWPMGDDAGVMPWITSANIACGFHAGDPSIMRATVALCAAHGVAIGAHPSLPDLQGFGRRELPITANEAYAQTLYQIGALHAFACAAGTHLHHVKPHGALYNMAARDRPLADAIAAAVRDFNPTLFLVGLAGGALVAAGEAAGLPVQREGFCDRRYRADGSLTPRREPDSIIEDVDAAATQAVSLATTGAALTADGTSVKIVADSLCIHGDRPNAAAFAARIHAALNTAGVRIVASARPA